MAVIREKRNFTIGPIGVARVSGGVAGSNAAGTIAAAVSDSANQMADMFFRASAKEAEKVGLEQGQTVSREQIVAIDPVTGQPKAYEPPKGFGGIAQEAYQRVVMSRFQASIEEEIKLKARELAVRYDGSVDRYSTAMSEYIGAMAQNAQGQFKTYITDVGTSYLNATRSAMAIDQMQRERAAAAAAQRASISEGLNAIEFMVSQGGPSAVAEGAPTAANVTSAGVEAAIQDGVTAQIFTPEQVAELGPAQLEAVARGLVRYAAANTTDVNTLKMLKGAIGAQNFGMIPEELSYVRDALVALGPNFKALDDFEKFSDDVLTDQIDIGEVLQAQEIETAKAEQATAVFDINADADAFASVARNTAASPVRQPSAVASMASQYWQEQTISARNALAAGNKEQSDALLAARDKGFNGYVEGLELRAVQGLTKDQTFELERAVMERRPAIAPAGSADAVRAILSLESVNPNISSEFLSFVGSYREGAGKAIEVQAQSQAFDTVNAIAPNAINQIRTSTGAVADATYSLFLKTVDGTANLRAEDAEKFRRSAAYSAGLAHMTDFFTGMPTEQAIDRASAYIASGTDDGTLSVAQRIQLDKVREYGVISGNESELRTQFGILESRSNDMRLEEQARFEQQQTAIRITSGAGDPTSTGDRKAYEDLLQKSFGTALGGQPIASVFTNPASLSDPTAQAILQDVATRNVLPESLHNLFASTSNGGVSGAEALTVLSHWGNIRSKTVATTGAEIVSPAVRGLTADQVATLDMMFDYTRQQGSSPEAMNNLLKAKYKFDNDPTFKARVETVLESTLDDFVISLDGIGSAPLSAYNEMKAATLVLLATSEATGYDVSNIRNRLERQLDRSYPDGEGIVLGQDGGTRTYAALSVTVPGNEFEFKDFVLSEVLRNGFIPKPGTTTAERATSVGFGRSGFSGSYRAAVKNEIYLEPVGVPQAGQARYRVMVKRPVEEGGPVAMVTSVKDQDGIFRRVPMFVSTRDPAFETIILNNNRKKAAEAIAAQQARMTEGFKAQFLLGN